MGKHGPCYHCGVTSTPLWRNGPPEKPVLCNACGSRWRTKGSLENYTPLHARGENEEIVSYGIPPMKKFFKSIKNNELKFLKRKRDHDDVLVRAKVFDEDISNRSSSGSAISISESCAQFGSTTDASDLTGPSQSSVVWDSMVPSRKRSCMNRWKPSSIEKLTKDLHTILHEQDSSSYLCGSLEKDLIFESDTPMESVETGHGSVLFRHPSLIAAREEESEASSFSVNKLHSLNEEYSCSKLPSFGNMHGEMFQVLGNVNSLLCCVDLKDVINYKEFMKHMTKVEQQQLLKYLPSIDTSNFSDSLKRMFDSTQFEESLHSFQQLMAEGILDISFSKGKSAEFDNLKTLEKLVLANPIKSKWVEHYNLLKRCGSDSAQFESSGSVNGAADLSIESRNKNSGAKPTTMGSCESNDDSCFSPQTLFALPSEDASFLMDSIQFNNESSDQELLLDVPSYGSFPQAELLYPNSSSSSSSSVLGAVRSDAPLLNNVARGLW